jgi:hypothetical protein
MDGEPLTAFATSSPSARHATARKIAAVCRSVWQAVPSVGIDLLAGIALFFFVRIPAVEFGNKLDRVLSRHVPTVVLESGAYDVCRTLLHASTFVTIGWIIGGLNQPRRRTAIAGAVACNGFLVWWYSTTASIPQSSLARGFLDVTIAIGGLVVGYRLWSNRAL